MGRALSRVHPKRVLMLMDSELRASVFIYLTGGDEVVCQAFKPLVQDLAEGYQGLASGT
jgi:hypothetical protein